MIAQKTAYDIACAYREIEVSEKLLAEITAAMNKRDEPDIRDGFGRPQRGLQLGVPMGDNSQRMFNVPWSLAKPVIDAHIANQRSMLQALNVKAQIECHAAEGDENAELVP